MQRLLCGSGESGFFHIHFEIILPKENRGRCQRDYTLCYIIKAPSHTRTHTTTLFPYLFIVYTLFSFTVLVLEVDLQPENKQATANGASTLFVLLMVALISFHFGCVCLFLLSQIRMRMHDGTLSVILWNSQLTHYFETHEQILLYIRMSMTEHNFSIFRSSITKWNNFLLVCFTLI